MTHIKTSYHHTVLFLIILTLFSGCNNIEFPAVLSITGIPFLPPGGKIESYSKNNGFLTFNISNNNQLYDLKVSPWPDNINLNIFNLQAIKLKRKDYPDSPALWMEFYEEDSVNIILGSKTRKDSEILPEWRIKTGDVIKKVENSSRFWTSIILSGPDQRISVEPGQIVSFLSGNIKWTFLLIGASIPDSYVPEKSEENAYKPENVYSEDKEKYPNEQPGLTADWILYRN